MNAFLGCAKLNPNMRKIEATGLDLNLLIALQMLLRHNQVSAAAAACGVTTSAMSRSLARLRLAFADPLLTPVGRSLTPTNRALELLPELEDILRRIDLLSSPASFAPSLSDRTFKIACTDYETSTLLLPLVQQLRISAPGVRLHLINGGGLGVGALQDQTAELALLSPDGVFPWAKHKILLRESFMSLVPKSALPLTRKSYMALRHVVLATGEAEQNPVDALLHKERRDIACRAQSFTTAIDIACNAHWAFNVPARLISRVALPEHMCIVKPVITVPQFDVGMYWHIQTDKDPGLRWLRGCIAKMAEAI